MAKVKMCEHSLVEAIQAICYSATLKSVDSFSYDLRNISSYLLLLDWHPDRVSKL